MELHLTNPMQTLTPHEIAAVGGGPESSVGSGMNPPAAANQESQAMRVLSAAEIVTVAGGPEATVGSGLNPP